MSSEIRIRFHNVRSVKVWNDLVEGDSEYFGGVLRQRLFRVVLSVGWLEVFEVHHEQGGLGG